MNKLEFFLVLALGIFFGWVWGRVPLQTELAQLATTHAKERETQATAAYDTLTAEQARGDALSAGLLQQQAKIDQLKSETRHAITQATTGSTCLREPALRLLNTAPGLTVAGLPQAPSGPAAAGGAIATDTDLTGWAIDAGAAYATCSARLDALIDFITQQPTPRPAP